MTVVRDVAAVLVLVQVVFWCFWRWGRPRLRRWWAERRRVRGWCEKCNRELRRGQVWEVRAEPADDQELGISWAGGTYMSAEYCREHAPPEAKLVP